MLTTSSRFMGLLFLSALLQPGCSSTLAVEETAGDRALLEQVKAEVGAGSFFVPAEVRFSGPLRNGDDITVVSSSVTGGNTYRFPVYEVVRESCELAVHSAFKTVEQPPKEFLRDQALEVVFSLREVHIEHSGGDGDALCELDVSCEVRYPAPSTVVVDSFQTRVSATSMIADDGTGANGGPGVLWVAGGDLVRQVADRLKSDNIQRKFSPDRNIAWRSDVDGHAPPSGKVPRYDVRNSWGEYRPVVKLTDFGSH